MFDLKLSSESLNTDSQVAQFEPDITSLVSFKGGRVEFMRNKTQILILQNYESIKQRMLTGAQVSDPFAAKSLKAGPKQAIMDAKLSGYGFLAGVISQQQQNNQKKRKREEFESATGRFMYKFKEGHSKNFKRELTFDYFLA